MLHQKTLGGKKCEPLDSKFPKSTIWSRIQTYVVEVSCKGMVNCAVSPLHQKSTCGHGAPMALGQDRDWCNAVVSSACRCFFAPIECCSIGSLYWSTKTLFPLKLVKFSHQPWKKLPLPAAKCQSFETSWDPQSFYPWAGENCNFGFLLDMFISSTFFVYSFCKELSAPLGVSKVIMKQLLGLYLQSLLVI